MSVEEKEWHCIGRTLTSSLWSRKNDREHFFTFTLLRRTGCL